METCTLDDRFPRDIAMAHANRYSTLQAVPEHYQEVPPGKKNVPSAFTKLDSVPLDTRMKPDPERMGAGVYFWTVDRATAATARHKRYTRE